MNEMRKLMEALEAITEQNIVHIDPKSILGNSEAEMEDGYDFVGANFRSADWKADPEEVLQEVAIDLASFGLRIEMINLGDDQYHFRVMKRMK